MLKYTIDGNNFTGVETFYDEICRVFSFPESFGRNLDALYDSLSDIGKPMEIIWKNNEKSKIDFSSTIVRSDFYLQLMYILNDVCDLKLILQ